MNVQDQAHPPSNVRAAVSNGIAPPSFDLPLPDRPEIITANLLKLLEQTPDPRRKFIFQLLVKHLHAFVSEANLSTDEWMTAIEFLTRVGQTCTPLRQEMILLSDVLGVSALVDSLNNPVAGGATENSVLGPFYTEDAADVEVGGSIVSEEKAVNMYVEGRVLTTEGKPIPGAIIETWEADANGYYDTQYTDRTHPDYRGRLRSGEDGRFEYRAIVPRAYPIPGDGPVGELLLTMNRHNMRPNHIHMVIEAPGYHKLVTALYPEGCKYLVSDSVFGVKKSLVVKLQKIEDEQEVCKRGFPKGGSFILLQYDFVLLTEEQSKALRAQALTQAL